MSSQPWKDPPDEERRRRGRRLWGRLALLALVAAVVGIFFVPVRLRLPTTFTVQVPAGFTGPFRVVADSRCEAQPSRDGLDFSVVLPVSGQVLIGDPAFDHAPRRGRFVGAADPLPEIGAVPAGTSGISPLILSFDGERSSLVGFVGTASDYKRIGGYAGLRNAFSEVPYPVCFSRE